MIQLNLRKQSAERLTILCLGAHSDDIEIGCGGSLLQLKGTSLNIKFHWVVFAASGTRGKEARKAAELFTAGCEREIVVTEYQDGFLPYSGSQVKDYFEELKGRVNPDLIFTHWQGDAHQDHRLICELTWNTFRDHLILEYEIPKYDGDMGRPNVFVRLDEQVYRAKVDNLWQSFETQHSKPWFQREMFLGLMRLRGMEANAPSGYAEAFHGRKLVINSVA